jgi:hypothetical protein
MDLTRTMEIHGNENGYRILPEVGNMKTMMEIILNDGGELCGKILPTHSSLC